MHYHVTVFKKLDTRTRVLYTKAMLVQSVPDTVTKLIQLGDITRYEPAGDQPLTERQQRLHAPYQSHSLSECVAHLSTPHGKKPVLKAMMQPTDLV
jgi:hypothetical protein